MQGDVQSLNNLNYLKNKTTNNRNKNYFKMYSYYEICEVRNKFIIFFRDERQQQKVVEVKQVLISFLASWEDFVESNKDV